MSTPRLLVWVFISACKNYFICYLYKLMKQWHNERTQNLLVDEQARFKELIRSTQNGVWKTDLLVILCCWGDLVLGVRGTIAQDRAIDGLGVGAVEAVPGVATVQPRQFAGHGGEQVVEWPGDDDVVVEAHVKGDDNHCVAYACGARIYAITTVLPALLLHLLSFYCYLYIPLTLGTLLSVTRKSLAQSTISICAGAG